LADENRDYDDEIAGIISRRPVSTPRYIICRGRAREPLHLSHARRETILAPERKLYKCYRTNHEHYFYIYVISTRAPCAISPKIRPRGTTHAADRTQKSDSWGAEPFARLAGSILSDPKPPAGIVDHAHPCCLYRYVQTSEMDHLIAPSSGSGSPDLNPLSSEKGDAHSSSMRAAAAAIHHLTVQSGDLGADARQWARCAETRPSLPGRIATLPRRSSADCELCHLP